MQTFKLQLQRPNLIVWTFILVPLVGVALLLLLLLNLPFHLTDWMILIGSFVFMGLMIAITLWLITKKLSVPCAITVDEKGLRYVLLKSTFFSGRKEFFSTWDNIDNISENLNTQKNMNFYLVRFKEPSFTISLDCSKEHEAEGVAFYKLLIFYTNLYNETNTAKPITTKGFYESRWAKTLTHITLATLVVVLGCKLYNSTAISWWNVAAFGAFAISWLANVYANKKRK